MGNEVPDTVLVRECDVDVLTNQLFPDVDPARASDARRRPSLVPADDQINSPSFVGGWEAGVSGCDQRLDRLTHVGVTPRPRVIFLRPRLFDLTPDGFHWLHRSFCGGCGRRVCGSLDSLDSEGVQLLEQPE